MILNPITKWQNFWSPFVFNLRLNMKTSLQLCITFMYIYEPILFKVCINYLEKTYDNNITVCQIIIFN